MTFPADSVSADFEVSTDQTRLDPEKICSLLAATYWAAERPREVILRSLPASLCFGLFERKSGRQIGFARVVTDHATVSWICDVIVDPGFRGSGLGKFLMSHVVGHPSVRCTQSFLATRDAHGLYEKFGFERSEKMRRPSDADRRESAPNSKK